MCFGINCPIKEKCYRFTAKPSFWQSWMSFTYDKEANKCKDFLKITK
jgi:hypothetical protein